MVHTIDPQHSPLPMREGVAASYIWLQKGDWPTVLAFLYERFPDIEKSIWLKRAAKGEIVDDQGNAIDPETRYFWGRRIFYYREIQFETPIPFEATILHQDKHLLVIDKPHFLPVIPTGRFLHETLLVRLRKLLNCADISPIHRLDRETAGVMIFSINKSSRGAYQSLFQQRSVEKTYEALAGNLAQYRGPFIHCSRMVSGEPFICMKEVAGEPNSETHITLVEKMGEVSRYLLKPTTGRKHQLRVHLASLGIPIINDKFYPATLPCKGDDFSKPLKLLSRSIQFIDPISGKPQFFSSQRRLES